MTATDTQAVIRIRGARTHNLQNVDVDVPLGKLVVMTGVSGSGKSTLAFDTLFAEGQRRYLESVSVHTRSLVKQLTRPDVDEVQGLPPTISVDQRVTTAPARSTLAVTTEIYDYLRLLYARAGTAHCTQCGRVVSSQSVDEILQRVLALPERTRLMILSPLVRDRKGAHQEVLERIGRNGFVRVRINGELHDVSEAPALSPQKRHTLEAVIDRIIIKPGVEQRLRESIDLAIRESDGTCIVCRQEDQQWVDELYSAKFHCASCNISYPTPETRTFSFHSAWGACETCAGFGVQGVVEEDSEITVFRQAACTECEGSRLQPFARRVEFLSLRLGDFTAMTVDQAIEQTQMWLQQCDALPQEARLVADRTLPDVLARLQCLQQVGVGYLTLSRATRTLSGGEYQRARLSACLGAGLHGACFVLDEPTSGLHPRDTHQLLQTLLELRDRGASLVVVEHDAVFMQRADHLLDLGPGAGTEGGHVVGSGSVSEISQLDSPTGRYLRGELQVDWLPTKDLEADAPVLHITGANLHNLQSINVDIPLGKLVGVTGVSGSGKSSLIMETLLPVLQKHVQEPAGVAVTLADVRCQDVSGLEAIARVTAVDNSPIGRNRRSCIATFSGLWDDIRRLFAQTRDAKARGFKAGRFSFNAGTGRCQLCKGAGFQDLKMAFLPDATVVCPECGGQRFNRATLAVKFGGHSVADVLDLRVDEAVEVFAGMERLRSRLELLHQVGLGYLKLGQPASTFSGGEAQRVKLATELSASLEPTVFVLDEPTSGLHPADVCQLLKLLRSLVEAGHSVLVIEHNPDVIRHCDWIIDIGPESGPGGGQVVATGAIAAITGCPQSITGQFLQS
ncbi:MAG: ATP-binding cassette domain-containing protein [Planctomycetaceae bacterium]|nr:ATP-binding cassette domain-containing protein [Planctomycetaceae bacterium]